VHQIETYTIVSVLAIVMPVAGIIACVVISRTRFARLSRSEWVSLGITRVPAEAFYKLLALVGLAVLPAAAMFLSNYHTFEGAHKADACARFNNENCPKRHRDAPAFQRVTSHQTVFTLLSSSAMSCTNCHGRMHPTRADRTRGSALYPQLMRSQP
jgi:hypothetical protein